jgi:hypothetical protein
MCKRLQRLILAIGIVGSMLVLGGGCSFSRTPRGWIVRSGCALEYMRPFRWSLGGPASAEKMIGNNENSVWLHLLQRRGRLGICANCKKMTRLGASAPPPTAGDIPVNAKFNPVPTQPVFTAREFPLGAGNHKVVPGDQQSPGPPLPSSPSLPSEPPEEIPAPPSTERNEGDTSSQHETSREQSSWVFSKPPEQRPDPVVEAPLPSAGTSSGAIKNPRGTHASQPSTRR